MRLLFLQQTEPPLLNATQGKVRSGSCTSAKVTCWYLSNLLVPYFVTDIDRRMGHDQNN